MFHRVRQKIKATNLNNSHTVGCIVSNEKQTLSELMNRYPIPSGTFLQRFIVRSLFGTDLKVSIFFLVLSHLCPRFITEFCSEYIEQIQKKMLNVNNLF